MATSPGHPAWAVAPNQSQQQHHQHQQQQQHQQHQQHHHHQQAMAGGAPTQQLSQGHYQQGQHYNQRPSSSIDPPPSTMMGHPQNQNPVATMNTNTNNNNNSTMNPIAGPVRATVASLPTKPTFINHRASTTTFLNPPPRGAGITTSTPDEELEDGRVRNTEAVAKIRDAWIYTQISARAAEFTQHKNVSWTLHLRHV